MRSKIARIFLFTLLFLCDTVTVEKTLLQMIKQKYTIVPLEEYQDTSGLSKQEILRIFTCVNFLSSKNIGLSFSKKKGKLIKKDDIFKEMVSAFHFSNIDHIVQIKNGEYRLLCSFKKTPENEDDFYEKLLIVDQEYFPTFFMPFFRTYKERLMQKELPEFFESLYLKDKRYVTLYNKINELRMLKNKAVKLQDMEKAAGFRDKENIAFRKLNAHLISKVIALKEQKPYLDIDNWMNLAIAVKKPI